MTRRSLRSIAVLILMSACSQSQVDTPDPMTEEPAASVGGFEHFITRDGATLYEGDAEFRFISINVPTLFYLEDRMAFDRTDPYGLPNEYEIRDIFGAVQQIGGQVIRGYTIPVRNENFPESSVTFVEAPGVFNEEAFKTLDLAVALASEYRIRLILPLVNNWQWMGGRPNYAAFRGKDGDAFCTDAQIIADYKATIDFVVNRVNTITGIPYNEDPTIMAWETGNEMTCPAEWSVDIAQHIKANAPKQLVVDGWHAVHMPYEGGFISDFVQPHSIEEDSIDLVSTHHYEEDPIAMLANLRKTVDLVEGKKPVFVGEFGFMGTAATDAVMEYIISEPRVAGGLIWSLRRHHRNGGWYYHTEPLGGGLYRAYHWPGFPEGKKYDESGLLTALQNRAHEIANKPVPSPVPPGAPKLLASSTSRAMRWQGSVGALDYQVYRAPSAEGPWSLVASGVSDHTTPGFALFSDQSIDVGEDYFYRIVARGHGGVSEPSNVIGPLRSSTKRLVDDANGLGVMARWFGISIRSDRFRSFKEATNRFFGTTGSTMTYMVPGDLEQVRVYSFEEGEEQRLSFSVSQTGDSFQPTAADVAVFSTAETNYDYAVPRQYTISVQGARYLTIQFDDAADIVRVELDYQ